MAVDVLIPALGDANLLDRALLSIVKQVKPPNGVIVIIDQPVHDAHFSVVSSYERRIANLKALGNDTNIGIHASTMRGLQASSADWIIFLDHDDELLPTAIRDVCEATESSPERLDAVFAGMVLRPSDGLLPKRNVKPKAYRREQYFLSPLDAILARNYVGHLRALRRSELIMEPDSSIDGAQDWYWNMLAIGKGNCASIPNILYRHYIHSRQFGRKSAFSWLPGLNRRRRQFLGRPPCDATALPESLMARIGSSLSVARDHSVPVIVRLNSDETRQETSAFSPLRLAEVMLESQVSGDSVVVVTNRDISLGAYVRAMAGGNWPDSTLVFAGCNLGVELSLNAAPYFDHLFACSGGVHAMEPRIKVPSYLSRLVRWLAPVATCRRRLLVGLNLLLAQERDRLRRNAP